MTRPKVVDLHPPVEPGYGGKHWEAERMATTRRWALVGRIPGRPNSFTDVLEVRFTSNREDPARLVRNIAVWLNEQGSDGEERA